jgi:hypothetical protein
MLRNWGVRRKDLAVRAGFYFLSETLGGSGQEGV